MTTIKEKELLAEYRHNRMFIKDFSASQAAENIKDIILFYSKHGMARTADDIATMITEYCYDGEIKKAMEITALICEDIVT